MALGATWRDERVDKSAWLAQVGVHQGGRGRLSPPKFLYGPLTDLVIRTFQSDDTDVLAAAFASWPKPRELFENYDRRVTTGDVDLVVAVVNGSLAGFLIIEPESSYRPFAASGVPEIADLNVLPHEHRHGVGTALMDEAERRVAVHSAVVGLGVGLYADSRGRRRRQAGSRTRRNRSATETSPTVPTRPGASRANTRRAV